jgi:hypothetical protein
MYSESGNPTSEYGVPYSLVLEVECRLLLGQCHQVGLDLREVSRG